MTAAHHPGHPATAKLGEKIAAMTASQTWMPGVELFQQGAMVQDVYFIASGLIKLVHFEPGGRELIIGLRSPGGLVGSAAVLADEPSLVAAITLTRCELHRVPRGAFIDLVARDRSASWELHRLHAREVLEHVGQISRLATRSPRHRLEHVLRQLISTVPGNASQSDIRVLLPIKHWEIARLIAVSPEHLSRLLKRMQQEGVIRREKGWVIVTHVGKLTAA